MTMFTFFDHTADLGIRAESDTPAALFAECVRGLFAAVVENPESIRETESESIGIVGEDDEEILFNLLRTLLYRFETEGKLVARCEIVLVCAGLTVVAFGEDFDPARHVPSHEVKAVTLHGFEIRSTMHEGDRRYSAEFIVDI